MSMNRLLVCALCLMTSFSAFSSTKFIESNFEEARNRAQREGKMLLLDFYASWCAPCRFMETTTFKDEKVSSILNEKFIPLKINIDDFDGYALKEHFGVKVLPTFIIFNSDGKVIERIEETLSPSHMVTMLEKNLASFKPVIKPANISPKAAPKKIKKGSAFTPQAASYKVQLGMYNSYDKTLAFYKRVSTKIEEPVIILHDYKGGNVVYRVLIGNFESTEDAHFYISDLLDQHGIQGHIYM